jgi:hypothetical protein
MEATMSSVTRKFLLAVSLAVVPALVLAQDRAVPRGGGGGGGGDAGGRHVSPSGGGSGSSGSSSPGGYDSSRSGSQVYSAPRSNAERRHPRAGTGSGGAYYPGYSPGYPGYGWGWYYPGYGGYWWPYGYYGWYGSGYWGYPGYYGGGGAVYYSNREREGASLRVLVDPSEARVYVDGYYAGVVDDFDGLLQRLHVSPGRHEIALKLEGYKTHRMRVYVGPDATLKLHHDMEKGTGETFEDLSGGAPPPEREVRRDREDGDDEDEPTVAVTGETGRLELTVEPSDASVYVDGAFRGTGREAASLRLPPGRHRIEVVRPGYRTAENEIDVPAGETTKIRVTLERPSE